MSVGFRCSTCGQALWTEGCEIYPCEHCEPAHYPQQGVPVEKLICRSCKEPFVVPRDGTREEFERIYEHMHWRCFHFEFEHTTEPDERCPDPSCPVPAKEEQP